MKILLSPTKTWNKGEHPALPLTMPSFIDKAIKINQKLGKFSKSKLKEMLHTSDDLTTLNHERIRAWQTDLNDDARSAVFSYGGQVYLGLDAASIPKNKLVGKKTEAYILSGLYGVLRLTDGIYPYRLEMQSKLSIGRSKNLYEYWKSDITEFVKSQTKQDEIIVDLTSAEYGKAIDLKNMDRQVIKVAFKDNKNGVYKNVMTYSKFARGYLTRFLLQNQVTTTAGVKKFKDHDYQFNADLSDAANFVFTRG